MAGLGVGGEDGPPRLRVAVLDDYAGLFQQIAPASLLAGCDVHVFHDPCRDPDELVRRLLPFDAVLLTQQRTALPATVLDRLPQLKLISQTGSHSSHVDLQACERHGIAFRTGGKGGTAGTTELTWALILAAVRHLPFEAARLRAGFWQSTVGTTLSGKALGIYGFGRIGSRVASIGTAFGMTVTCLTRETSLQHAREAGFAATADRARFFADMDIITLHLPLNPGTRGVVGADDLARMKPSSLLVNTSRAELVAPGALHAALVAGRPGFAAVDVFEREPVLGADDELLRLEQVVATPHLGYAVREQLEPLLHAAAEQVAAFASAMVSRHDGSLRLTHGMEAADRKLKLAETDTGMEDACP